MFKRILSKPIVSLVVQFALRMIVVFTVFSQLDSRFADLDLDRCERLPPKVVDDSMPYPENEPCSEECFLRQVCFSFRS